ncbi:MAG: hypothetical protein CMO80_03910 [Verrucomicrobiales bacterium]|nr:hypothetical protein [Verrucomicrobiales bacterium]|tara:strand:+ start:557 stop:1648 length:1092 start_codon:yes stop_codon:yes gene_type:complete
MRRFVYYCSVIAFCLSAYSAEIRTILPIYTPDRVDVAIERGIQFLMGLQNQEGYIQDHRLGRNKATTMTALSVMAFAAVGHQPGDRTPQGRAMSRALDYVLQPERMDRFGYFGGQDASRMYGHGIITLALTEMLGMGASKAQDALIRDRSLRGIQLILRSQAAQKEHPKFMGGWRYYPDSRDADLSITVWQLMALRSAKNAGLGVPKKAIDAAYAYLWRSYYSKRDAAGNPLNPVSGFGYMPGSGPRFAMTAAGLLAMQVIGGHERPEVKGASEWLMKQNIQRNLNYFYYGIYYYAQGMKKQGGRYADHSRKIVENLLLAIQNEQEGNWEGSGGEENHGRVYATSLAILSLSVKHGFLPIYQD